MDATSIVLHHMRVPGERAVYVLGSFERRLTLYSQQVRALNLVYALTSAGHLRAGQHVAVIGGGAAGLTGARSTSAPRCMVLGIRRHSIPCSWWWTTGCASIAQSRRIGCLSLGWKAPTRPPASRRPDRPAAGALRPAWPTQVTQDQQAVKETVVTAPIPEPTRRGTSAASRARSASRGATWVPTSRRGWGCPGRRARWPSAMTRRGPRRGPRRTRGRSCGS